MDSLHETRDKEELVTWNQLELALRGSGESLSSQRLAKTASGASLRKESQRSGVGSGVGGGGGGVEPKSSTESVREEAKNYDGDGGDDDPESRESGLEGGRAKDGRQRLAGKSGGTQAASGGSVHRSGGSVRRKKGRSPDDGKTASAGGGGGPSPDLQEILRVLGSLSEKFYDLSTKVSNIEVSRRYNFTVLPLSPI